MSGRLKKFLQRLTTVEYTGEHAELFKRLDALRAEHDLKAHQMLRQIRKEDLERARVKIGKFCGQLKKLPGLLSPRRPARQLPGQRGV